MYIGTERDGNIFSLLHFLQEFYRYRKEDSSIVQVPDQKLSLTAASGGWANIDLAFMLNAQKDDKAINRLSICQTVKCIKAFRNIKLPMLLPLDISLITVSGDPFTVHFLARILSIILCLACYAVGNKK